MGIGEIKIGFIKKVGNINIVNFGICGRNLICKKLRVNGKMPRFFGKIAVFIGNNRENDFAD